MFDAGLIITLVGMLGVFLFLIILVISMDIMSNIIEKYFPEKEDSTPTKNKTTTDLEIAISIAAIKSFTAKENVK